MCKNGTYNKTENCYYFNNKKIWQSSENILSVQNLKEMRWGSALSHSNHGGCCCEVV